MIYLDYIWELSDNAIVFDDELRLKVINADNSYSGKLPVGWKEGDTFILAIKSNGRVILKKTHNGRNSSTN